MTPLMIRLYAIRAACKNPIVVSRFPWNSASFRTISRIDRFHNYYREAAIVFTSLNSVSANYAVPPERCHSLKEFLSSLPIYVTSSSRNANFLD